MTSDKPMLEY